MNEAISLLRELADKLGQSVEVLWPEAVKYVWASHLCASLLTVLAIAAFCGLSVWLWKKFSEIDQENAKKDHHYRKGDQISYYRFLAVVPLVFAIVPFSFLAETLPGCFAPVGKAVMMILGK